MRAKRRRTVSPERARAAIMGVNWYTGEAAPARVPSPALAREEIAPPTASSGPVAVEEDRSPK